MTCDPISPAAPVTRTSIFGDIERGSIRRELDLQHLVALPLERHDLPKDSRVIGARSTRRFSTPAPEGPRADVETIIRCPPCQIAESACVHSTRSDDAEYLYTHLLLTM
jgi:hypothetical protein